MLKVCKMEDVMRMKLDKSTNASCGLDMGGQCLCGHVLSSQLITLIYDLWYQKTFALYLFFS